MITLARPRISPAWWLKLYPYKRQRARGTSLLPRLAFSASGRQYFSAVAIANAVHEAEIVLGA